MLRHCILIFLVISLSLRAIPACSQEVIDRVAGRVEADIILLSEVRALSRYQTLVEGKAESDSQIFDRLVDQWIVRSEADNARFPHPSDSAVSRGVERLQASFATPEEYQQRKKEVGLDDPEIRRILAAQLYLSNYLDSRFRTGVQVDPKAVEDFYEKAVIPRAKARNQAPPSLEASRLYIQEALIQQGINEQADRWLKESRLRLHVEKLFNDEAK